MHTPISTVNQHKSKNFYYFVCIVLPALLGLTMVLGSILHVYNFKANDWDYGLFSNLIWNFAHGNDWYISLYEGQVRSNFLADHFAIIVPLLAPFFYIFESTYTLTIIHSLSFSLTFFLVPILTREICKKYDCSINYLYIALLSTLILYCSKGFSAAWFFQSHLTTIVMPFILLAILALYRKSIFWAVVCCIIIGIAQERAQITIFGIGLYAILITKNIRLGVVLCTLSTISFFITVKLIIPSFYAEGGEYIYASMVKPFAEISKKIKYLLILAATYFFLPFCGKKAFFAALCAGPCIALNLVSNRTFMYSFYHQYQDHISIFLLVSTIHGLSWLSSQKIFTKIPRRALYIVTIACLLISVQFTGERFAPILLINLTTAPAVSDLHQEINKYKKIPEHLKVYTTSGIGPHFSMRKYKHHLSSSVASIKFVNSILFIGQKTNMYPDKDEIKLIENLNQNFSIQKVSSQNNLIVYASKDILSPNGEIMYVIDKP